MCICLTWFFGKLRSCCHKARCTKHMFLAHRPSAEFPRQCLEGVMHAGVGPHSKRPCQGNNSLIHTTCRIIVHEREKSCRDSASFKSEVCCRGGTCSLNALESSDLPMISDHQDPFLACFWQVLSKKSHCCRKIEPSKRTCFILFHP